MLLLCKKVIMRRNISKYLLKWKEEKDRKVLLLRGARQVGKTYSIRRLGADFEYFIEVNLEEEPNIHSLFQDSLNPLIISENLSGYFGIPIIPLEVKAGTKGQMQSLFLFLKEKRRQEVSAYL